jgi:hypothetical protein
MFGVMIRLIIRNHIIFGKEQCWIDIMSHSKNLIAFTKVQSAKHFSKVSTADQQIQSWVDGNWNRSFIKSVQISSAPKRFGSCDCSLVITNSLERTLLIRNCSIDEYEWIHRISETKIWCDDKSVNSIRISFLRPMSDHSLNRCCPSKPSNVEICLWHLGLPVGQITSFNSLFRFHSLNKLNYFDQIISHPICTFTIWYRALSQCTFDILRVLS